MRNGDHEADTVAFCHERNYSVLTFEENSVICTARGLAKIECSSEYILSVEMRASSTREYPINLAAGMKFLS